MTTYLISAGVLALLVLAIAATELVARKHRRSILARFAEPGADVVPLPPVSTLPVPEPDGWSARSGFNAWRAWLDAKHAAVFDAEPAIFTDLALSYAPQLAIEARRPLELTGATT